MEAQTVPSSNRYLPSGLSSLSFWPLHDGLYPPSRNPLVTPPISSVAELPNERQSARVEGLTMALRADQRESNVYVEGPRCAAPPGPRTVTGSISPSLQHSMRSPHSLSSHEAVIIESVPSLVTSQAHRAPVRSSELKLPRRHKDPSSSSLKINSELSSRNNSINTHCNKSSKITSDHHTNVTSQQSLEYSKKIITTDNRVKTLTSETQANNNGVTLGTEDTKTFCRQTIACQRCGGCRCDECIGRTSLPQSVRQAVDVVSCLCCVQTVFYHCRGNCESEVEYEAGEDPSDRPCSCTGQSQDGDCCRRWTCMVGASLSCLPCLLLYWPLRLLAALGGRCYDACTDLTRSPRGCRCAHDLDGKDVYKDGRMMSSSVREWSSEGPASSSSGHELLGESGSTATTSEYIAYKLDLV